MRVTIYDLDYMYKTSFIPNIKCMKLASYHIQKQNIINFVTEKEHINMDFDIMYIVKEMKVTQFPSSRLIDDPKVKLVGKDFTIFPNYYELDMVIEMCRPDYNLYIYDETNRHSNAHMIQLLHKTKLLPIKQDYINSVGKGRQSFIVTDEFLWKAKKEIIIQVLEELKQLKNIFFLYPISLKTIISNQEVMELFLELKLRSGDRQPFKNDYGSTFEKVKSIVDFIVKLKETNPNVKLLGIPVKAIIYDHWKNPDLAIKDIERCLQIISYSKKKQTQVILKSPKKRLTTPYWAYFDIFEVWTVYSKELSYIEAMLYSARHRIKSLTWYQILNNQMKWITPRIHFLLYLITKYPEVILPYGGVQWADKELDLTKLKLEEINNYSFFFNKEETLKKLEREMKENENINV